MFSYLLINGHLCLKWFLSWFSIIFHHCISVAICVYQWRLFSITNKWFLSRFAIFFLWLAICVCWRRLCSHEQNLIFHPILSIANLRLVRTSVGRSLVLLIRWSVTPSVGKVPISLFIFYKNIIFWPKPSKEIEIATNKINMMFLILGQFQALIFF